MWVKKFDLGFGIRASVQDAFDPPSKRGALALVPFCLKYQKGIPSNLWVHGSRVMCTTLPEDHPKYTGVLEYTGGGMIDDEELELLRTVKQVRRQRA